MNQIQIFNNPEFGEIRTIEENEQVLFCGKDIAAALGYKDTTNALKLHCREDGVAIHHLTDSLGREQQAKFIDEGNLYRLIAHSKLPAAEKFERWVFDEVLPSIRKHGAYMTPEQIENVLTNPDTIIQLAQNLKAEQEKRRQLECKVEEDKPKVLFADAVATSKTSILIGELAKILKQNGVDMGQNRLFHWMRQNGYLISRQGTDYNMPTQKSMEMKLFEIKETSITHADGHVSVSKTPKITGRGQQFFIKLFLEAKEK